MTTHHPRKFPVVLITGTPGCGKTLHSQVLAADSDVKMTHLNIGDIVKQHGFHNGFDEEWKSYIVDEDRLLDYLEEVVNPEDGAAETGECSEQPKAARLREGQGSRAYAGNGSQRRPGMNFTASALDTGVAWSHRSLCSLDCRTQLTAGFILDHHDPSLFPERWVDLAVVLTCDNSVLYERLKAR